MDKEKAFEYVGYGVLGNLFKRLAQKIKRVSGKVSNISSKLYFEQYKMLFGELEDDIYIVTYPKSGTTMMQMILYQLTTDGNMDFEHIYQVSPWIRNASLRGEKPRNLPSPRIIKSHDGHQSFPKSTKGRFIFVYRNGMDVAVSLYHQNKNYNNPNLDLDKFIKSFFKSKAWFKYCKRWLENKKKFPVHYVRYEDLLSNKEDEIERIIGFLGIQPTEEQKLRAVELSSFEFMKQHEDKFGDKEPEKKKVFDQFIRKGKVGEGKASFNEEQQAAFEKIYQEMLAKEEIRHFNSTPTKEESVPEPTPA